VWQRGTIFGVPELIEVEMYRRAAEAMLGRPIAKVVASDAWYLKEGTTAEDLFDVLVGAWFSKSRRIGKLLLLDIAGGRDHVLGLRFGMTGRLVVDGGAAIENLLYSSHRDDPKFVRFAIEFADGGRAELSDPRRLGGVALNPELAGLGPDAATVDKRAFVAAFRSSTAPLKARLLDQSRLAGVGNLIADEVLWRAKLSPTREARSLSDSERARLHRSLVATISDLSLRGGSHMGDLMAARHHDGVCPRCGTLLGRKQVGGRTTYWCPREQQ
jgi:formamidopyrimidine-DNA glycosylase